MKSNVTFSIIKNALIISNVPEITDHDLYFEYSKEYIQNNFIKVSNTLNKIISSNNVSKVKIASDTVLYLAMDLINTWENINYLDFDSKIKIDMKLLTKILDNKFLNKISCYEISDYLMERIDLYKDIKISTRHQYNNITPFMKINSLTSYSDIYYKKFIVINDSNLSGYKEFIKLNNHLKKIRITNYSDNLLRTIIEEIIENNKANIIIEIDEEKNNLKTIEQDISNIRKKYYKYIKHNHIKIIIHYSKEYKYKNFFKEINFKLLIVFFIFLIISLSTFVGINYYKQYLDINKVNKTMKDIESIYKQVDDNNFTSTTTSTTTVPLNITTSSNITTKTTESIRIPTNYLRYNKVFEELSKINNDTIGWIKINNTKINYPVVKTTDNSFYLNHDFNKDSNKLGWIFMDYRNNPDDLDFNTIIFGHNMRQGLMFGTIKNMFKKSWYTDENNLTFEFSTKNKVRKWQIFSLYQINETSDYLETKFSSMEEYQEFLKMLKNRSIYNFNYEIQDDAKILTLSTCFGNGVRHVVHAVLIEELEKN